MQTSKTKMDTVEGGLKPMLDLGVAIEPPTNSASDRPLSQYNVTQSVSAPSSVRVTPTVIGQRFEIGTEHQRPAFTLSRTVVNGVGKFHRDYNMGKWDESDASHVTHGNSQFTPLKNSGQKLNNEDKKNNLPVQGNSFQLNLEDFPALPAVSQNHARTTPISESGQEVPPASTSTQPSNSSEQANIPMLKKKPKITMLPNGTFTNIPESMLKDQFGIIGVLAGYRAAERNPNLVYLGQGIDLNELELNLNAEHMLHPYFNGPFVGGSLAVEDMQYDVPKEYEIGTFLASSPDSVKGPFGDALTNFNIRNYGDELLFYLFYQFWGDKLQMLAAAELFHRDWRYHKMEQIWIRRIPGFSVFERNHVFECGRYYYHDPEHWERAAANMIIEYSLMEI